MDLVWEYTIEDVPPLKAAVEAILKFLERADAENSKDETPTE
ncbi:MAG: hypothetical protein U0528_07195 [Anaerolineae bacterium]